jgi:uncharacterized protein YjeT (DUF2065 family)
MSMVGGIAYQVLVLTLMVMLAMGLVFGLLAVIAPASARRIAAALGRQASSRRALRVFETPIRTESFVYRHHRASGGILTLMSFVVLAYLQFRFDPRISELLVAQFAGDLASGIIVPVATVLIWAGALLGLVVGVLVILRPSLLKGLEAPANRWISTRRLGQPLERQVADTDRLFAAHTRLVGAVIAASCLIVFTALILVAPR